MIKKNLLSNRVLSWISLSREVFRKNDPSHNNDDIAFDRRRRYVRAAQTAITSAASTVLTAVVGLLSVPLTVGYLGVERYGLWLTIGTILTWLSISDLGIGNGLINLLSEANGKKQTYEAQQYVSSAFWLLFLIGLVVSVTGILSVILVPWNTFLNATSIEAKSELPLAIGLVFVVFGIGFPLSVASKVFIGYQEGYYNNYWSTAASVFSLIALFIVTHLKGGLPILVIAVFGVRQLTLLGGVIFLFGFHRPWLLPLPRKVRHTHIRRLLSVGSAFVLIQFAALLIQQTDILVVARQLGPESVAVYGTILRLFTYVGLIQTWILAPLWPAYGEAYIRLDDYWIRKTLKYSIVVNILFTFIASIILLLFSQRFIQFWASDNLVPSFNVVIGMALLWIVRGWTEPFVNFLNGVNRVRGQTFYGVATAFINFALQIVAAPLFGLQGVIYATLIAYILITVWMLPIESYKVLRGMKSSHNGGR